VHRSGANSIQGEERDTNHARLSPTVMRHYNPNDPEVQERQRTMDVDSAMQLSRARSGSTAHPGHSVFSQHHISESPPMSPIHQDLGEHDLHEHEQTGFPYLSADGEIPPNEAFADPSPSPPSMQRIAENHDASMLASLENVPRNDSSSVLPVYQPAIASSYRSNYDFNLMEQFATDEKTRLGIPSLANTRGRPFSAGQSSSGIQFAAPTAFPWRKREEAPPANGSDIFVPADTTAASHQPTSDVAGGANLAAEAGSSKVRQRKLSQSNARPRRKGGKMALFEGSSGAPPPSLGQPGSGLQFAFGSGSSTAIGAAPGRFTALSGFEAGHMIPRRDSGPSRLPPPLYTPMGGERPYRFSFYSNALSATIHARSLSELPAEGQTFEDLFRGVNSGEDNAPQVQQVGSSAGRPESAPDLMNGLRHSKSTDGLGVEPCTWWLDVTSPTDEEMKLLSKVCSSSGRVVFC
jgi:magnesium transporter